MLTTTVTLVCDLCNVGAVVEVFLYNEVWDYNCRCSSAVKCLCAQIRCRFHQSGARIVLRASKEQEAIARSRYLGFTGTDIYIQTRSDNTAQLLASLYSSATNAE